MKMAYGIMIGIGACVFVVIAFFAYVQLSSGSFAKDSRPFIEEFISDLSNNWEITDVYGRLSSEFLSVIDTPKSKEALRLFQDFGPLKSVKEYAMTSYHSTTEGKIAVFTMRGEFEYGNGIVTIKLVEKEGVLQVGGIHINVTEPIEKGLIPKNA